MLSIDTGLIEPLRDELGLVRAVETGTYMGDGLRRLATLLPEALSIELSPLYYERATAATADLSNAVVMFGHSADVLPTLRDPLKPTLWFLDGHWSAADTAGWEDECPLLREIPGLAGGHPDDVIVIDDARFLLAPAEPPLDPAKWPTLLEVIDAVRQVHPRHDITLLNDQVIALPLKARSAISEYAAVHLPQPPTPRRSLRRGIARRLGLSPTAT